MIFVKKEKIGASGGYRHIYNAVKTDKVADLMEKKLDEMYAEMGKNIQEFRDKYSEK